MKTSRFFIATLKEVPAEAGDFAGTSGEARADSGVVSDTAAEQVTDEVLDSG